MLTTVRADANAANGMTLGLDGRLLVCEQGPDPPARISAVDRGAAPRRRVVDASPAARSTRPNDVVVTRDGTIWFTDPSYGFLQGFRPRAGARRLRLPLRPAPPAVTVGRRRRASTSRTGSRSRRTSATSTSATAAPTRSRAASTRAGRTTSDAFDVRGGHLARRGACSRSRPRLPRRHQGRRRRPRLRLGLQRRAGLRADGRPARRDPLPGAVNFTFGGPGGNVLFITTDSGRLGRRPRRERSVTAMAAVERTTQGSSTTQGADAVIARRRGVRQRAGATAWSSRSSTVTAR